MLELDNVVPRLPKNIYLKETVTYFLNNIKKPAKK